MDASIDMPVQDIWAAPTTAFPLSEPAPVQSRESAAWRIGVLAVTALATAIPAKEGYEVLSIGGMELLDSLSLALFVLLFAWTAYGSIIAATGFILLATGGASAAETGVDLTLPDRPSSGRCAVLMPVYNEDAEEVLARIEVMARSLDDAHAGNFDFFVLSDTRDPAILGREGAGFRSLTSRWGSKSGVFYRRRAHNTGRKAGNVADWVRRFGGAYRYMAVLDADSLMEGETLVRLTAAMDRNGRLGLLQTAPMIVSSVSLFGRLQQFASRLYGPLHSEGLAWWSGAEGNYWGHNAMIRVRAFAESAGLPSLPGPRPFGGEILSHDFVEAALLRRAGWEVRMAPEAGGSFEACPPTISDMLVRERRWCQGNLQHSGIIAARGLHWTSRMHLVRGVSSYLVAPLWLAFIVVASLQALSKDAVEVGEWSPESLRILAWLLLITLVSLAAPKVLSLALVLFSPSRRREWGAPGRLVLGMLLEVVLSALIAPVLMAAQVRAFVDVLAGRDSGWAAQKRDARAVSWRDAARRHGWHTAAGVGFPVICALASPAALAGSLPAALGLALSIPMERLTSSVAVGDWLARHGILLTPEEGASAGVLAAFARKRPSRRAGARRLAEAACAIDNGEPLATIER